MCNVEELKAACSLVVDVLKREAMAGTTVVISDGRVKLIREIGFADENENVSVEEPAEVVIEPKKVDELQKRKNAIGERIKNLRREMKMTQAELGAKLGLTYKSISMYETSRARIPYDNIMKMAKIFGVKESDITGAD